MQTPLKRSDSDLSYTGDTSRFELAFYVDSYLDMKNQLTNLEPTMDAVIKAVRERYPDATFADSDVVLDLFSINEPGDYSWKGVFVKGYGHIGQVLGRFKELPAEAILPKDQLYFPHFNTLSYRKLKAAGLEVHELMHTPLGPVTDAEMGAFLTERGCADQNLNALMKLVATGSKNELVEAIKTNPIFNQGSTQ